MQDRLRQGPGDLCRVDNVEFKDYSDTKIKLHFSHFKLLVRYVNLAFRLSQRLQGRPSNSNGSRFNGHTFEAEAEMTHSMGRAGR